MRLFTIKESSRWLETTPENLRRMIDAAQVEAVTPGGDHIFVQGDALWAALLEYNPSNLVEFERTAE